MKVYTPFNCLNLFVENMHLSLLEILACPKCAQDAELELYGTPDDSGVVQEGSLSCTACQASYVIENAIPRFIDNHENYCQNFGFQWQKWKDIQIDRLSGHHLSENRFFSDTRWDRDWMEGKLILDAGCGAGRFTDVALSSGARVVAIDLSGAIDACRETTEIHGQKIDCIQASLFALPFKKGVFDGVYCIGVIQHTPNPEAVISGLPQYVRHGGKVAYNFYEEGLWRRLQVPKYALRLITPHLPISITLGMTKFLVACLFWLTGFLAPIRKIRILNHFIPICAVHDPALSREQQYVWTLLDTFDWYGPRYEKRQNHGRVAELMTSAQLENVTSEPGLAWGSVPRE
jgi:SAM-dependent methyltransferase